VKRILHRPVLVGVLVVATMLALFAPTPASRLYAQSPLFPNNQPVIYNPYGDGPYGKYGQGYGGMTFKPLPAAYSQPLPSPNVGYWTGPYSAGNIYGFGSSPYVRNYGGASSRFTGGPIYIP
jgi:hypothetical protein